MFFTRKQQKPKNQFKVDIAHTPTTYPNPVKPEEFDYENGDLELFIRSTVGVYYLYRGYLLDAITNESYGSLERLRKEFIELTNFSKPGVEMMFTYEFNDGFIRLFNKTAPENLHIPS